MRGLVNPFQMPGQWYKANLHTHTRSSDGALWPKEVVPRYRRKGYRVLALTDHERTNDIRGLSNKKMLVINGSELHPPRLRVRGGHHILTLNLPHSFPITRRSQQDIQTCLNQVKGLGGLNILAHPRHLDLRWDEFVHLKNLHALEVWNTLHQIKHGQGSSEKIWAEAMDHGLFISAVASDNVHQISRQGSSETFGGWTWLKMRSLSIKNVVQAIRSGACYTSTGPKINDFRVADGQAIIKCSPVIKIVFKGPNQKWRRCYARAGQTIRSFAIDIPDWPFVRAVVTDESAKQAWTNPIPPAQDT